MSNYEAPSKPLGLVGVVHATFKNLKNSKTYLYTYIF